MIVRHVGCKRYNATLGNCKTTMYVSLLPPEYERVEAIYALPNAEAYINLDFAFDTSARIQMGHLIYDTVNTSKVGYLFGATETSGKYRCLITSPYTSNGGTTLYGTNNSNYIGVSSDLVFGYKQKTVNEYEAILKPNLLELKNLSNDSYISNTTQVSYKMTNKLFLLGQNYNGTLRVGVERCVSYFKYYDKTNTLICDLVPCYRKSDGVEGYYDIVRNIFLTNAGTGQLFALGKTYGGKILDGKRWDNVNKTIISDSSTSCLIVPMLFEKSYTDATEMLSVKFNNMTFHNTNTAIYYGLSETSFDETLNKYTSSDRKTLDLFNNSTLGIKYVVISLNRTGAANEFSNASITINGKTARCELIKS